MKKIILDFKNVKNKQDVLNIFQSALDFAILPKNFDSLDDSLSSLDTESQTYIKARGKVRIIVENLNSIKTISNGMYLVVNDLLKKNGDWNKFL